jgi:hypothetical protein
MVRTLTQHYIEVLKSAIIHGGFDPETNGHIYYGTSAIRNVRPLYNKIVNSFIGKQILHDGGAFALQDFAVRIAKGEYIYSMETFAWYCDETFGPREYNSNQITLEHIYKNEPTWRMHEEELISWGLGMSIRYPVKFRFSPTHGLNALTIRKY